MRRAALAILWIFVLSPTAFPQLGPYTAEPRSVRSRDFDSEHLRLEVRFDWDQKAIDAVATLRIRPFRDLQTIKLDAIELQVHDVAVGTSADQLSPAKFRVEPERLVIEAKGVAKAGRRLWVRVKYRVVNPKWGVHFVVPGPNEPRRHRVVWTQNEAEFARYWIPCYDAPNDRLTSETIVTVPAGMFVLSNGVLKSKKDNGDGTVTWHWVQEQDHVVYLVSIVAGTFVPYEQRWKDIPITSYVPPEYIDLAENSFVHTPAMMDLFSRLIGVKYPWPKYAQICCDEYSGGMEHTSATTLALDTLHDDRAHLDVSSDGLVAHELAHQWWGNLLTCKDWAEIWLNESFATYFATLWTEHHRGWDEATWERYQHAQRYLNEARRYRRPIVTYRYPHPMAMFDAHSYPKGGRVLHTLRYVLGDRLFFRALNHYARKNAFRVVETADLRVAIEESTGQGLNWFFDQWVYGAGHPEFRLQGTWNDEDGSFKLTVRQVQEGPEVPRVFRTPVQVSFLYNRGQRVVNRRITVDERTQVFVFRLDERPDSWCFDGPDWVLDVQKVKRSDQEWAYRAQHDPHLVCRYEAVRQLDRRGVRERMVDVLSRVAQDDSFWAVRAEAARVLGKAGGRKAKEVLLVLARKDVKSDVRRAAIQALGSFRGEDVAAVLEEAARQDRSYFVVADAIRALSSVAPEKAKPIVREAIGWSSYREVILRAAADSAVRLGVTDLLPQFTKILEGPSTVYQRVAVYRAALRLSREEAREKIIDLMIRDLRDPRRRIRQTVASLLAETGSRRALEALRELRSEEVWPWIQQSLDDAIQRLEQSLRNQQQRLESLERRLRELEEAVRRLKKAS